MNRNRNMKIDFRITTKRPDGRLVTRHDHFIEPKHGARVLTRATKPKKKGLKRIIKEVKA